MLQPILQMAEPGAENTGGAGAAPPGAQGAQGASLLTQTGADGGNLLDWRSSLAPEVRDAPVLQKYGSLNEAVRAFVNAESLIGRSVQIPPKDAPQEVRDKFFERLGRPKTARDYALTVPDLPKGVEWDKELTAAFAEEAHAMGLTQEQYDRLVAWEGRRIGQAMNLVEGHQAQARADGQRKLAQEFGAAAPRKLQQAQYFFEQVGGGRFGGEYGKRAWEAVVASGLANNPDVIATFADAFDQIAEGEFVEAGGWGGNVATREQLDTRRQELLRKQFSKEGLNDAEKVEMSGVYKQLAQLNQTRATAGSRR